MQFPSNGYHPTEGDKSALNVFWETYSDFQKTSAKFRSEVRLSVIIKVIIFHFF